MRQRGMCFDYPFEVRNATVIMLSNMFLFLPRNIYAFRKINGQTIKNAYSGLNINR